MPSEAPAPPTPEHLNQTQLSVEPPTTTPPEPPKAIPDELLHTQMFVEPAAAAPAVPKSTGELMESILEGDDAAPPAPAVAPPAPPPIEQASPPSPPNQAATQFFDGPSALDPDDADLAPLAPPPTPSVAPSGFEALALGGGPDSPSAPAPSPPPAAARPSPADMTTQPSVQPVHAPPVGGPPIQREALVPPRRHVDELDPDKDGVEHVLGNDEK